MKKIITILILTLCIVNISFTQITRTGSFVQGTPAYPISGDVTVHINGNNLMVDFENNFSTEQGINLEVFLSVGGTLNYATDLQITTTPLDFGSSLGDPINGAFSFTVPAGTNLFDFDNVLIQCTSAGILWGKANLCESVLDISVPVLNSDTYLAASEINCSAELNTNLNVFFETQDTILLSSDFEVPSSTNFNAILGTNLGCIIE